MFLFRAINNNDAENIRSKKDMVATLPSDSIYVALNSAGNHIFRGSNLKSASCWISTTKSFKICAEEFSVPQMGGFNTATKRKNIAIINRDKIINNNNINYNTNGNYTYISDGVNALDLGDGNSWPPSVKLQSHGCRFIMYPNGNKVKVNNALRNQHINIFNKFISNLKNIETFIFDMNFPTYSDRRFRYVPLNEFSYLDYYNNGMINSGGSIAYISGLIRNYSEVLIMNTIPFNSIEKVLSLLEIDILYALNDEKTFNSLIKKMISNQITIQFTNNTIMVNGTIVPLNNNEQKLVKSLYSNNLSIIELAYQEYINNKCTCIFDILKIYDRLKNIKRNVINSILNTMGLVLNENINILEDKLYVAILHNSLTNNSSINERDLFHQISLYDLLMIGNQEEGTLYKFNDSNYEDIWKNCNEKIFIITDNQGKIKLVCCRK